MTPPPFNSRAEEAIAKVHAALADGFDAGDVSVLVRESVEFAEAMGGMSGPQKRELAIAFTCDLIDKFFHSGTPRIEQLVEAIDWPLLPDAIEAAVIDPWVKKLAVPYAKGLLKSVVPSLVDLVVDAAKGKVNVNKETTA